MTKTFKFSVKTETGRIIHERIVTFGSEKNPLNEDWKFWTHNYGAQNTIADYRRNLLQELFTVEVSEELDLTIEHNQIEIDKINFTIEELKALQEQSHSDEFWGIENKILELQSKIVNLRQEKE